MDRRRCIAIAGAAAWAPVLGACATRPAGAPFERALAAYPEFIGTVVVGRGAEILYSRALGLTDPPRGAPITLSTRFEAGSVSKWIAAMTVMHLVDAGALALDRPIIDWLPDYRPDSGARLTLRHLLSHASGVPNDIMAARKADPSIRALELDQAEAVRRYASGDLAFAPGSAWDYSHANWIIVKAIVERAAGLPYADYLQSWLFAPLRLRDSGIFQGDSSRVAGMAVAHDGASPGLERKISPMPGFLAMAGGFYSSAPDMLRLMDGVLGGELLSAAARAELMRVVMPKQHYALGGRTRVETIAGQPREAAWEDGSNGGFRLVARRVLADGMGVVVFNHSSVDHRRLGELASALMEALYA